MFSKFFNVILHAKKWRAEKWRIFEILSTNEMRHFLAHHCIQFSAIDRYIAPETVWPIHMNYSIKSILKTGLS